MSLFLTKILKDPIVCSVSTHHWFALFLPTWPIDQSVDIQKTNWLRPSSVGQNWSQFKEAAMLCSWSRSVPDVLPSTSSYFSVSYLYSQSKLEKVGRKNTKIQLFFLKTCRMFSKIWTRTALNNYKKVCLFRNM